MKILAIDDNVDNLVSLGASLSACLPGCQVDTACSGAEGIESARKGQPDVILLDIRMPGMDGFEVCTVLKGDPLTRHIPVVFLTAQNGDGQSRVRGLEIGGDAFLSQPVDQGELTAQVRAMLRLKRAEDTLRADEAALDRAVAERTRSLAESEERFRTLFDEAPIGYQSLDAEGKLLAVNEAWLATMGYSRGEVLGKELRDFIDPESLDRLEEFFTRFKEHGGVRGSELWMRRKDGPSLLASFDGKVTQDAAGHFLHSHCVFRDITEQRRAEEAVRESQRVLRTMIDAISESVFLMDRDGTLLVVNETFAARVGRSVEESTGRPIIGLVPEEVAARRSDWIEEAVRTGRPVTTEDRRGERWLRHTLFPIVDPAGQVVRIAGFAVDITESRRLEETLMEQLDELRRWHEATLGREGRVLELKREVNALLAEAGRETRYPSARDGAAPGPADD